MDPIRIDRAYIWLSALSFGKGAGKKKEKIYHGAVVNGSLT